MISVVTSRWNTYSSCVSAITDRYMAYIRRTIHKERKISNLKLKMFAALVLRAMARELAEQGTERVSPRDRGVASRLGMEPDSPELAAAERYLVLEDYIRPSSADHKDGPFIITEFGWKDLGYQLSSEGWRVRPFWKRLFGA
jgi:hypothetical protein